MLLNLESFKNTLANIETEKKDILTKIINNYLFIDFGIFYKVENSNDLYISDNINDYIQKEYRKTLTTRINKNALKKSLSFFKNVELEEVTIINRFINENNQEVIYEESNFKKAILIKFPKKAITKIEKIKKKSLKKIRKAKEFAKNNTPEALLKKTLKLEKAVNQNKNSISSKWLDIYSNNLNFLSLDTEFFEFNHDKLLEIGITFFNKNTKKIEVKNLVIEENLHFKNEKHVISNPLIVVDCGTYQIVSQEEAIGILDTYIKNAEVLIGHNIQMDIDKLPESNFSDLKRIDTTKLAFCMTNGLRKNISLIKLCKAFDITIDAPLHNAANDSYYTFKCFETFMK